MSMPLCVCGHQWGEHAMPPDMDYDIDNGERWCYADDCRCKRYVEAGEARSVGRQGITQLTSTEVSERKP